MPRTLTATTGFRIHRGDCCAFLWTLPRMSIDLVIADPPYGQLDTRYHAWDRPMNLVELWQALLRVGKPKTAYIFTCKQPYTSVLVQSNLPMFKYELIWQKEMGTDFGHAKRKPITCHENILVFAKEQPVYNAQKLPGKPYTTNGSANHHGRANVAFRSKSLKFSPVVNTGDRYPVTVLKIPRDNMANGTSLYPTQKPVALMEWIIKTYSNPGMTILDPCMGSGSTGVACRNSGRNFIGCDLRPEAFTIAQKRLRGHL